MYYVITKQGILANKTINGLNKKHKTAFEQAEFYSLGKDFIVQITDEDFSFLQDKKRIQNIAISKLFKKDNTNRFLLLGILILSILTQVRL